MANVDKLLTIGMAVYDDYNGVYFTLKALQIYHPKPLKECELLVVDNNPDSRSGRATKSFVEKLSYLGARYVPYTERRGTSAPRDHVIRSANTPWVLVCDPHIFIHPGSLEFLLDFIKKENPVNVLLSAALLTEDENRAWLHMYPKWRGGLFGIWAEPFLTEKLDEMDPMEISATGLGLFVCNKEFWPGFHPQHKGFGGEEFYIHEKYRKLGGYCLALPKLRYSHRFGYDFADNKPYPDHWYYRVRNYVLEFEEIGWDIEQVGEYYVTHGYITPADWQYLLEDPVNRDEPPSSIAPDEERPVQHTFSRNQSQAEQPEQVDQRQKFEQEIQAVQKIADEIVQTKDITEIIKKFSPKGEVINFGVDLGNDILTISQDALDLLLQVLVNAPEKATIVSLCSDVRAIPVLHGLSDIVADHIDFRFQVAPILEIFDPNNEISTLALDLKGQNEQLLSFVERFAPVSKKIILYNGNENGELENKISIKLLEKFPEFSVHDRTSEWFVIFDRSLPKKGLPSLASSIVRYTKSIAKRVVGESVRVSDEEVERRLSICAKCEYRSGLRCSICGCYLIDGVAGDGKVFWSEEKCPKEKW